MDFHQLRIFASVYKHNSFTKASEALNISQPTISEHIKNLETELSCKLFDRLGRSIIPTPPAENLYYNALSLLDQLESLKNSFRAGDEEVHGELVVGASTIPGTYIIPEIAGRFRQQYPQTSFEVRIDDTAKIRSMVASHDILCGVVGSKSEDSNLDYRPLVDDELVVVTRKSSGLRVKLKSKEILQHPLIVREKGSGTRDAMMRLLADAGVDPSRLNIAATLGSSASVKEAVKAGLGASILSRIAVTEEIERGELVELEVKGLSMKRKFYLVTHRKRTLPNHYEVFCRFVEESCRG